MQKCDMKYGYDDGLDFCFRYNPEKFWQGKSKDASEVLTIPK